MRLNFLTGLAVAIALVSTPALACKGKKTAFSDDFARQDPSWVALLGEFGVSNGRAQLKSGEGKFAAVGNDGDPIAQTLRLFHVMRRENDGRPRVDRSTNHAPHGAARCRIEPGRGFV